MKIRTAREFSLILSAILIFFAGYFLEIGFQYVSEPVQMQITLKAEKPTPVQVANLDWSNQITSFYDGSDWETITFNGIQSKNKFIIKSSFVPSNRVLIRDLTIIYHEKQIAKYSNIEIKSIDSSVEILKRNHYFESYNPTGFAQFQVNLPNKTPHQLNFLSKLNIISDQIDYFLPILILQTIVFIRLVYFSKGKAKTNFAVFLSLIGLTISLLIAIWRLQGLYTSEKIIGKSAYRGFSPLLLSNMTIFTALLMYLISLSLIFFRIKKQSLVLSISTRTLTGTKFNQLRQFFSISILGLLTNLDKLVYANSNYRNAIENPSSVSWDLQNIQVWDALTRIGYFPNFDFWYPYGYKIFLNFYPTISQILDVIILVLITLEIMRLLLRIGSSEVNVFFISVIFLILASSVLTDMQRIGIPLLGILLLAKCKIYSKGYFATIGIFSFIALLFGADVFGYFMGGLAIYILTIFLIDSFYEDDIRLALSNRFKLFIIKFLPITSLIFTILWLLPLSQNVLQVLGQAKGIATYSSDYPPLNSFPSYIWLLQIIFLVLNVFFIVIYTKSSELLPVIFALVAISFFHLSKSGTRTVFWVSAIDFILISILVLAISLNSIKYKRFGTNILLCLIIGYFTATYLNFNSLANYGELKNVSVNVMNELKGQFLDKSLNSHIRDKYLDSDVIDFAHKKKIFVYGDSPAVYLASTNGMSYWISNLYNASLPYDQSKAILLLETNAPDAILVDLNSLNFDTVPHYLRNNLILRYLLEKWQPEEKLNARYWILKSRNSNQDLGNLTARWVRLFGSEIDLGWVPTHQKVGVASQRCNKNNMFCGYKLVEVGSQFFRSKEIMVNKVRFFVTLSVENKKSEFIVNTSYLWPTHINSVSK